MVDIKDVPRDKVLEALQHAVDPDSMQRYLEPHFGQHVEMTAVKVERFQYKPGRSARISYVIKLRDRNTGERYKHILCGRMESATAIVALHVKMRQRQWTTPRFGPALLWLPDLSMLLWGFPNDPKLEGIERIGDPQQFLQLLQTLPAAQRLAPVSCEGTVVKYVPGKRLVMKHVLRDAAGDESVLYSKTFGHDRGAAIYQIMHHLFECSRNEPEALTTPEPLGWLAEVRTLVQCELPGWSAVETLQESGWQRFMAQVGRGLAHIHASGAEGLESWAHQQEYDNLCSASQLLLDHDPQIGAALADLQQLAASKQAQLPQLPAVPIHTAFRFTQLLADANRLALVDFDGFRQGDAACDVGSFLAHLHYLAVKKEISSEQSQEAATVFLDAYHATAPQRIDAAALAWYTAVILVAKHAQKMVKRLKEDGDQKMQTLLDDALQMLQQGHTSL